MVWLERARRNIKTGKQQRIKLDVEKKKNKDTDLKACSRGCVVEPLGDRKIREPAATTVTIDILVETVLDR